MKFLLSEKIEVNEGDIKLTMSPITNMQQSRLIDLGGVAGTTNRTELSRWCLKNLVEKISISEQDFNPAELADKADLSDKQTRKIFLEIGVLVCNAQFPSGDDVKKS